MLTFVKSKLKEYNIDLVSCISLEKCEICRTYLLEKRGINNGSVIIFAVPYFTHKASEKSNISSYAVSRDYHLFFKSLFDDIIGELEIKFPDNKFAGFTDHSPINEIRAAAKSGLGVIGKNNLLITEKYSSFVFIGEIITDIILESNEIEIELCSSCGACEDACPVNMDISKCLSSLTQKKGELTPEEISRLAQHPLVWGCDACQLVCPYNKLVIKKKTDTPIPYFREQRCVTLTEETLLDMSEQAFSQRAYAWRGKTVILRNLHIKNS